MSGTLLVEDRQVGAHPRRKPLVQLDSPGVRCNNDQILKAEVVEVLGENEQRRHMVAWLLEETLDLAGVEVHRQQPVDPGGLEHPRDQA